MKDILEEYSKHICSKCINKNNCKEDLRVRSDGSVKCDKYKKEE